MLALVLQRQKHNPVMTVCVEQDEGLDDQLAQFGQMVCGCGRSGAGGHGLPFESIQAEQMGRTSGGRVPVQEFARLANSNEQCRLSFFGSRTVLITQELAGRSHRAKERRGSVDSCVDR